MLFRSQALDALLGALERGVREPATLELTQLPAQHLVVDAVGAGEGDVAHVDAVTRIDEESERDRVVDVVGSRYRLDLGERVAIASHAVLHPLLAGGYALAVEGVAGMDHQQLLELRLRHHEGAGQLDLRHLVDLALVDVDGDEDVLFLGRDRHLRRGEIEVRVTTIHVVVADFLQIALQRLARVAVVLLVPGEPVGRLQLEGVENGLLRELGGADDLYLADLGTRAFLDVDLDLDAVTGLLLDGRVDLHPVLAAGEVLIGEVLRHVLEYRAVEGLAGRKSDTTQRFLQVLGLDVLVTGDLEALDGGALEHHDDERVAVAPQLHVAEESGGIQCADRLAHALRGEMVTDVDGQVVVDGAFGYTLQAFDLDVAHREVRRCGWDLRERERAVRAECEQRE